MPLSSESADYLALKPLVLANASLPVIELTFFPPSWPVYAFAILYSTAHFPINRYYISLYFVLSSVCNVQRGWAYYLSSDEYHVHDNTQLPNAMNLFRHR